MLLQKYLSDFNITNLHKTPDRENTFEQRGQELIT